MSEPQLERSVLEAKERDELLAIANALGTKPTSRARKSELVNQILQATGVEIVSSETVERARRTRAKRPAGEGAADKQALVDDGQATDAQTNGAAPAAGGQTANGGSGAAEASGSTPATNGRARPAPVRRANDTEPAAQDGAGADVPAARPGALHGAGADVPAPRPRASQAAAESLAAESRRGGDAESGTDEHGGGGRYDSEAGNRRSRRRRGRDRGDRGERDLAGQSPDQAYQGEPVPVAGLLDVRDEGYGFLRADGFLPSPNDIYVSISQVRRFALRRGDYLEGASRPAGGNEKYPALVRVDQISGLGPDEARARPRFDALTPLFPDHRLKLEVPGDPADVTARIVELLSPIGKGQRGLIVSPPKAGKTTILKQLAHAVEANNPDVHLMILLLDERPEEVTDMRRSVKGEVVASTFDRPAEEHTQVAELAIERAKRMVELGRDVVIVLDGITRLARAYNLSQPPTGRIMSGGIDTGALYPPKKFFGAARNIEEGGSLTILATALVETGSKMDEVIFEEFKGTGNMELRLDRRLAERRIFPALDVNASSTRHEELLYDADQLQQVWRLRRVLNALGAEGNHAAGVELLVERIRATKSNDEFLAEIAKNPVPGI